MHGHAGSLRRRVGGLAALWVGCEIRLRLHLDGSPGHPTAGGPDRIQEVIWRLQPDVIIETAWPHGGSLVFYAVDGGDGPPPGEGRVIGVDIAIRPHNRAAIETHPMARRITLIEGSSTAVETVASFRPNPPLGDKVMVILDSTTPAITSLPNSAFTRHW